MSERWRGVVAALLDPEVRTALGELPPRATLTEVRRARALARLEDLGLVQKVGDDWVFDGAALRGILSENATTTRRGPDRFLDAEGRIDRYPQRAADRLDLLVWVAERAFQGDTTLSEHDVNERLRPFAAGGDVAVLRRYLVDHGLLERTRSGSEYARVRPSE